MLGVYPLIALHSLFPKKTWLNKLNKNNKPTNNYNIIV